MTSPEPTNHPLPSYTPEEKGSPRLIILIMVALGIVPILLLGLSFILHFWGFLTDPLFEEQLIASIPSVVIIALLTIIVASFLGWYAYRRLVYPTNQVTNTARRFIQGNWNERIRLDQHEEVTSLARIFNTMADELTNLYRSMESQVEDRTRQLRIANEVANMASSNKKLDDFLKVTVNLLVDRLGYHHASVFLIDEAGDTLKLSAATGHYGNLLKESGYRVATASQSLAAWVVTNNQVLVATDADDDRYFDQEDVIPGARSVAGIPIRLGNQLLGVFLIQSRDVRTFDPERIASLQTIANQIAPSIQNTRLIETVQVDLQETSTLYRASRQIAQARQDEEVYEAAVQALKQTSRTSCLLVIDRDQMVIKSLVNFPEIADQKYVERFPIRRDLIEEFFQDTTIRIIDDIYRSPEFLGNVIAVPRQTGFQSIALIGIWVDRDLTAVLMLAGENSQKVQETFLQPYASLAEMIGISLQKVRAVHRLEKRLDQQRRLSQFGQILTTETDAGRLFQAIYEHLVLEFGNVDVQIVHFNRPGNSLDCLFETVDGQEKSTAAWKPEQDWLAAAIRDGKPFRNIAGVVEEAATETGEQGRRQPSWLGVPLFANNDNFGMLVIKDPFNSDRFTEDDENILTILATPIAISLRNTQLLRGLQEAEQDVADRVRQLHTAAEIARDTVNVGMLNLDEHLSRISRLVRERFGLASAAIYLFDARSEALLLKQSSQVEGRARTVPEMEVLGGQSVISLAALRREPRLNVANSNGWFTRSNREQSEMEDELGIPILGGKELLGVFDLHLNHSPGFSQKGIEIYQVLADLIAVGILNTRLIGNIQEHLSIHRLLHHTASAAASSNTIEDALQSIANGLSVTYAGKRVAIYLANPDRCILELKSWAGFSVDEASTYTMPMDYGLIGWVADRQQPAMIPDTRLDDRHKPVHSSTLSILAVPLVYRDTLSGVLSLESDQVYGFTEIDQELVGTLGSTLAAIIANSQLLEKVQHQVDRQRRLYEITNQIRRSTDMETILKASAIELGKVLGTDLTRIEITAPPDRKLPIDPQSRAGVVEEE